MAEVIIMPKLGFNMDEGQLVRWNKVVGDEIKKGDVLFEINTDKTTMPVEATQDGILLKTMLKENEFAPVFTPIAVVGQLGEDADAALADAGSGQQSTEAVAENTEKAAENQPRQLASANKDVKLTPRAKTWAAKNGADISEITTIEGTGFDGGITERDILASPIAKRLAANAGVNLADVTGTGVNGKIMKADVEQTAASIGAVDGLQVLSTTPYKGIRKIIGEKLAQSKFTAPHLYFTNSVDMEELLKLRKNLNDKLEQKISVTDFILLAVTKALVEYPQINSSLQNGEIIAYRSVNLGVAVAGNNGLVVPVVRDAQNLSLGQMSNATKDLVARARQGSLMKEEYSGGTFTVSNLGMFGIENFTAIINPPESAILSVSSTIKKPVVITNNGEDEIVVRPIMNIQLSVDHRIIDGLLAAQFVGFVKALLEAPMKILV